MKGVLADVNIRGHVDMLVVLMKAEPWNEFWDHLQMTYRHFDDVGLLRESPDSLIWQTCQKEELILITENRKKDGPDSLEATIQACSTSTSLPGFTIANIPRMRSSQEYANRGIEAFIDSLLRIDTLRGTGRLYLP